MLIGNGLHVYMLVTNLVMSYADFYMAPTTISHINYGLLLSNRSVKLTLLTHYKKCARITLII